MLIMRGHTAASPAHQGKAGREMFAEYSHDGIGESPPSVRSDRLYVATAAFSCEVLLPYLARLIAY